MDQGRIYDLEEIYNALQQGGISSARREYLEKVMSRILNESGASRRLRDVLIRATRAGDTRTKNYVTQELILLRRQELGRQQKDYLPIKL